MYKVKEGLEISSGDFWYDCSKGGYIKPEEILMDGKDIEEVKRAIQIVSKFEDSCDAQIEDFIQ
jgi:hypothetical protein